MLPPRERPRDRLDSQEWWDRQGSHRGEGPALREYAIVLAVIALISVVALLLFGPQTEAILSTSSGGV